MACKQLLMSAMLLVVANAIEHADSRSKLLRIEKPELASSPSSECPDSSSAIISLRCVPDYESFVSTILVKMQKRIINQFCLFHILQNVVKPEQDTNSLWLEFGVFNGSTARLITDRLHRAKEIDHVDEAKLPKFYGFDSFKGLPETWSKGNKTVEGLYTFSEGMFKVDAPPFQDPYVGWVKGWFNESLPVFLESDHARHDAGANRNVSFAHLDADLYSSTSDVLIKLEPRLSPGCLLVFDDLLNYPAFRDGELKALWELVQRSGRDIEVIGATGPQVFDKPSYDHLQAGVPYPAESAAVRVL